MAVIHISEAEAARDLSGLLSKVRAGEEVRIESQAGTVAIVQVAAKPRKTLSEAIRLAEERNDNITLDHEFTPDLEAVIRNHENERPRDLWSD